MHCKVVSSHSNTATTITTAIARLLLSMMRLTSPTASNAGVIAVRVADSKQREGNELQLASPCGSTDGAAHLEHQCHNARVIARMTAYIDGLMFATAPVKCPSITPAKLRQQIGTSSTCH